MKNETAVLSNLQILSFEIVIEFCHCPLKFEIKNMFVAPKNIDSLLVEAQAETLYLKLIQQINKDFNLANEGIDFPMSILPDELKVQLHEKIFRMIQYKFAEYLNLLYIIDVPEDQIKKLDGSDLVTLAKDVAFLILKREWQKVWFRNHYSHNV